jgi:hypothetical protein
MHTILDKIWYSKEVLRMNVWSISFSMYEESVVVRFKSNLLLMIFWFYMFIYNS